MATETIEKAKTSEVKRAEPARAAKTYVPPVDIIEDRNGLVLLLDMPGVEPRDVEIQYENGVLTIHGKVNVQEPEGMTYIRREYGKGDYHRSFAVGEGIDASKIDAECRNGVVTLHLPKAEAFKPRRIEVKAQ